MGPLLHFDVVICKLYSSGTEVLTIVAMSYFHFYVSLLKDFISSISDASVFRSVSGSFVISRDLLISVMLLKDSIQC